MRFEQKSLIALTMYAMTAGLSTLMPNQVHVHGFTFVPSHVHSFQSTTTNGNPLLTSKPTTPSTSLSRTFTTGLPMASDSDDLDDDLEEYNSDPLSEGVDSISWLPSISNTKYNTPVTKAKQAHPDSETLPLFPLGGIVYTPNSEHVLNIFEPRYRQMYTDILMNGSKRFIVSMSHPETPGVFAETGVVFYLDDLKEVSEETGDQIKYICNHRVTKRAKLHKILNPDAWDSRETYLKVEATIINEGGEGEDENTEAQIQLDEGIQNSDIYKELVGAISGSRPKSPEERALVQSFSDLVNIQHDLEEDVRFTKASTDALAVSPGDGEDGLWMTIRLWQSFIEQRLVARQNEMQMEFQTKLLEFLKKEKGISENELPSAIGFNDLSPALQQEVQDLQKRMSIELQPMVLESTLAIQKILEAEDHTARCSLLKHFMDSEKRRLEAKKTLQGMFEMVEEIEFDDVEDEDDDDIDNDKSSDDFVLPKMDDDDDKKDGQSSTGSIMMDEPDAFQ